MLSDLLSLQPAKITRLVTHAAGRQSALPHSTGKLHTVQFRSSAIPQPFAVEQPQMRLRRVVITGLRPDALHDTATPIE
jgi:hypothetical protein